MSTAAAEWLTGENSTLELTTESCRWVAWKKKRKPHMRAAAAGCQLACPNFKCQLVTHCGCFPLGKQPCAAINQYLREQQMLSLPMRMWSPFRWQWSYSSRTWVFDVQFCPPPVWQNFPFETRLGMAIRREWQFRLLGTGRYTFLAPCQHRPRW